MAEYGNNDFGEPEDEHNQHALAYESEDEYEDDSESDESDGEPREPAGEKKQVQFSDIGQPISPGSIQYSTFVGKMATTHCRPTFVDWFSVPPKAKRHEKRKREDTETNFSVVMQRLDEETKASKILEEKLAHLADLSASDNQAGQC
ncbi:hypothetical protein ACHQM5_017911 [Ranunculus cassubicifolius]